MRQAGVAASLGVFEFLLGCGETLLESGHFGMGLGGRRLGFWRGALGGRYGFGFAGQFLAFRLGRGLVAEDRDGGRRLQCGGERPWESLTDPAKSDPELPPIRASKKVWEKVNWTQLTEQDYYSLIGQLRAVIPSGDPFWRLERYSFRLPELPVFAAEVGFWTEIPGQL